ncbi:Tim44 domain-containing protein [Castellaniella caeni]|uniref:Tim44 domain-containing protein n=1 Tax=Castellaniella caeni TaxID=266123 RepID=UPI00082D6D69|nr:TIM44-like domain-containing protein [Castellaniella caeni]
MTLSLPRWMLATLMLVAALVMLSVTSDAQARRMGGGMSFGRQSTNIAKQRQAVPPPTASTTQRAAAPAAGAAAGTAAAGAAKSGMSRWLGPLAGIAAGLGIAALLSSLGLSGAFLEFLSSALLIGLVVFAVMFLVRRLRGAQRPMAAAGATGATGAGGAGNSYRQARPEPVRSWNPAPASAGPAPAAAPVIEAVPSVAAYDPSWFIPADFDVPAFLAQAKQQFTQVQGLWDAGDRASLQEFLTDDLLAEITPRLPAPGEGNRTDIVLLNAELLGIETVAGGHLASVRYSGMLREAAGAEAFRFEEVWNLYKAEGAGWLLAGIQQLDPQ